MNNLDSECISLNDFPPIYTNLTSHKETVTRILLLNLLNELNTIEKNKTTGLKLAALLFMLAREIFGVKNPIEENGELSDKIGSGQQGEVYSLQNDTGGFDAVKLIVIKFETIEQLVRDNVELETLLYFEYKNVIPLNDAWCKICVDIDDVRFNFVEEDSLANQVLQNHARINSLAVYLRMPLRPMTLEMWIEEFKKYEDKREQNRSIWCRVKYFFGFGSQSVDDFEKFRSVIIKQFKHHFEETSSGVSYEDNCHKKAKSLENIMEKWDHNDMIFNIFYQLLKGLRFIHINGIKHGDIHPRNVFVGYDENNELHVELGDFGLACEFSMRHTGKFSTNPYYSSPEQLRGERNPKNDLYSLGVILLDILISSKPSSIVEWNAKKNEIIEDIKGGRKPENVLELYFNLLKTLFQGETNPNEYLSGIPKDYLLKWSSTDEEECNPTVSVCAWNFVLEQSEWSKKVSDIKLNQLKKDYQDAIDRSRSKVEGAYTGQNIDENAKRYLQWLKVQNESLQNES